MRFLAKKSRHFGAYSLKSTCRTSQSASHSGSGPLIQHEPEKPIPAPGRLDDRFDRSIARYCLYLFPHRGAQVLASLKVIEHTWGSGELKTELSVSENRQADVHHSGQN